MDLLNKVVIVIGGACGIGAEIVRIFLENGVKNIAILDVDETSATQLCKKLSSNYADKRVIFIKTDVTNEDNFNDAFQKTQDRFKKIDIVVNSAGILNEFDYKLMIDVNLVSAARSIELAYTYLSKTSNGHGGIILNIGSLSGLQCVHYCPRYTASKAGLIGLVRCYGEPFYYENSGITVLALCPGYTSTKLMSLNGIKPEEALESLDKQLYKDKVQKPDCVGRAAVYVVKHGKPGSVWGIELGKLFVINFPNYETYCKTIITQI